MSNLLRYVRRACVVLVLTAIVGLVAGTMQAFADTAVMPVGAEPNFAHSHDPRPSAVDFPEGCGSGVHAAKAGTITEALWGNNGGWGNTVVVQHYDGTSSRYAHLSDIYAFGGDVGAGYVLGAVGNTGASEGCHLHVETYGATAVDFFGGAGQPAVEPAAPAPAPAEEPAPVEPPATTMVTQTDDVWDLLASCESTNTWDINTGNGYYGGLQFDPNTWLAYGGGEFADYAHQATREQQILIAERTQASQGWNAWPTCTQMLGISAPPTPSTTVEVPVENPAPADPAPAPQPAQDPVQVAVDQAVEVLPAPAQELVESLVPQWNPAPAPAVQPQADPEPVQPVIPEQVFEAAPAPVQEWVEQVAPQWVPAEVVPQADPIPAPMPEIAPAPVAPMPDPMVAINTAINDAVNNANVAINEFVNSLLPPPPAAPAPGIGFPFP